MPEDPLKKVTEPISFNLKSKLASLPMKWRMTLGAASVGAVSGIAAVVFYTLLKLMTTTILELHSVYTVILPAIGVLISTVIVLKFAPDAAGGGVDAVLKSFHQQDGIVSLKTSLVKLISTLFTLGSGGSGGIEGPIAQIGSGIGSSLARFFGFQASHVRAMMLAGCAGGVGAIFQAPLGGAFISIEILYKEDFEARALVPTVISSITGYFIFRQFIPGHDILSLPDALFTSYKELPAYSLLALSCFLVGLIFIKLFHYIQDTSSKLKIPGLYKPVIGALFTGVIIFFIPATLGANLDPLSDLVYSDFSLGFLLSLVVFKMLATSFTVGSGGSAGIFGPSLFIGGMTGALLYTALSYFQIPIMIPPKVAVVMVGMAGFFTCVAKTPIGALIMACEIVGSFNLLVPLLFVNILSVVLSQNYGIFRNQVSDRFHSPIYLRGIPEYLLRQIPIKNIYKPVKKMLGISPDVLIKDLSDIVTSQAYFFPVPITDDKDNLIGILTMGRAMRFVREEDYREQKIKTIMQEPAFCYTDECLYDAVINFRKYQYSRLPIVDRESKKIVGLLQYQDIFHTYNNIPIEHFKGKSANNSE